MHVGQTDILILDLDWNQGDPKSHCFFTSKFYIFWKEIDKQGTKVKLKRRKNCLAFIDAQLSQFHKKRTLNATTTQLITS